MHRFPLICADEKVHVIQLQKDQATTKMKSVTSQLPMVRPSRQQASVSRRQVLISMTVVQCQKYRAMIRELISGIQYRWYHKYQQKRYAIFYIYTRH